MGKVDKEMTREEAIEILRQFKKCLSDVVFDEKGSEAWQMAIKALSQEPTVTSTDKTMTMVYPTIVCDDAISRRAALEAVSEGCQEWRGIYGRCEELINALPSVTQKSGKWIVDAPHYICSECNYVHHLQRFEVMSGCKLGNYCPNCGAKMESEEISEHNMKMWEGIFKAERGDKE